MSTKSLVSVENLSVHYPLKGGPIFGPGPVLRLR